MKYNTTIENTGALPVAYAVIDGTDVRVHQLYKDRPLHLNVAYMSGSSHLQLNLYCKGDKAPFSVVIELNTDVLIKHAEEAK